jgi:ketosteroid isomerase-like protein
MSVLFCLSACSNPSSEKADIAAIKKLMEMQEEAWSNYDLESFMGTYMASEALTFFSGGAVTNGWESTLENYRKRYPSKEHTGSLEFTLHNISRIDDGAYWVMGEYHLTRKMGNANGTFMVIVKRINGEWKIVADSSC